MIRVLVVGAEERAAVTRLVASAERPENHYIPGSTYEIPGDNPLYVIWLGDYRCVFTITKSDGRLWRHLSVSVPAKNAFPNHAAIEEIARLFGITGTVTDWARKGHVMPNHNEGCIVVVQEYPSPSFDSDLSPQHESNVEAAKSARVSYNPELRQYVDEDGCPRFDAYGQPL